MRAATDRTSKRGEETSRWRSSVALVDIAIQGLRKNEQIGEESGKREENATKKVRNVSTKQKKLAQKTKRL